MQYVKFKRSAKIYVSQFLVLWFLCECRNFLKDGDNFFKRFDANELTAKFRRAVNAFHVPREVFPKFDNAVVCYHLVM